MNLKEFKTIIENFNPDVQMIFSISEPFSWRGSYNEVCFSIVDVPTPVQDILNKIDEAYKGIFQGWKGGEYKYDDFTQVNFEANYSDYTDGDYCTKMIERYSQEEYEPDAELKLISLIIKE